mgnify:CR=1 FL=1
MQKKSDWNKTAVFRNEWKYYISLWDGQALKERFGSAMRRDPHAENGIYMIRSLYFDDYWNSAYNEKIAGVNFRKKYRIRIYNCSDRTIKLERKLKNSNYIYKESASLTRQEYEWIMEGTYDFLLKHPNRLCQEFYYECVVNVMRPKVIVDYEREPFILPEGNVRVTFDRDVRAAAPDQDIFNPALASFEAMPFGKVVLEVKFTEFLPQHIREALPAGEQEFSAISKYTLCYDRIYHRTDALFLVSRSEKTW